MCFFVKDWYDRGIRNIIDFINENGFICDFVDIKHKYYINETYLDYIRPKKYT